MQILYALSYVNSEAVFRRFSVKKVFLKTLQNSQENTYARVSFLITLQVVSSKIFVRLLNTAVEHMKETCFLSKTAAGTYFAKVSKIVFENSYRLSLQCSELINTILTVDNVFRVASERVPLTTSSCLYFLRTFKVWSSYTMFTYTSWHFFMKKFYIFIIFIVFCLFVLLKYNISATEY